MLKLRLFIKKIEYKASKIKKLSLNNFEIVIKIFLL